MLEYEIESPTEENEERELENRVTASLERAGLKERLNESVMNRLVLLEKHSSFNQDSRMIERGMDNLISYLTENHPELHDMQEHRSEARVAAILHDIGKSGPATASEQEQLAVIQLFAAKQIKSPQQTVEEVVRDNFGEEFESTLEHLAASGVQSDMTMRQFWDMHAYWTRDILEAGAPELSSRTKLIAASHHIDRGINPYGVTDQEVPDEARMIGAMEDYIDIVEERALIAIDQYQAQIERSRADHETAINWVRNNVAHKFNNDSIMHMVLDGIDKLGQEGKIFT